MIATRGRILAVGLLVLLETARGAAQAPTFDLARLSAGGPALQAHRIFDLTVDDAIERALDRNLDIAVERLNPQLRDLSIAEANAAFMPNLNSSFDLGRSVTPSRSQLDGRLSQLPVNTETGAAGIGIEQATRWYGGRYTLDWDNGRTETNNVFFSYNPSFRSFVALGYTQPLLRGPADRRAAAPVAGQPAQPRHLRHRPARDDHQHRGGGAPRLLGARLREGQRRRAAPGARARRAARPRQSRAGRDRHARADRHRPGAVRGRAAPAGGGRGGNRTSARPSCCSSSSSSAARTTRCGTPRSTRWIGRCWIWGRSTWTARSARRSTPARTSRAPAARRRSTTSRCAISRTTRCRRSTWSARIDCRARAARGSSPRPSAISRSSAAARST